MSMERLKRLIPWYWLVIIVTVVVLMVLRFYDPIALGRLQTEHTYFRNPTDSATNGQLHSQRWKTVNWWVTGLYALLWLVPFGAMYMLATTKRVGNGGPRYFHIISITDCYDIANDLLCCFVGECKYTTIQWTR